MRCRYHPRPHAVGRRPSLVRPQVWMPAMHLVATHRAPTDPHAILGRLRSGPCRKLGLIGKVDALCLQGPPTRRASFERHRHVYRQRSAGLIA
jgi:hypothetical protein